MTKPFPAPNYMWIVGYYEAMGYQARENRKHMEDPEKTCWIMDFQTRWGTFRVVWP
jgi:hypothetical protein